MALTQTLAQERFSYIEQQSITYRLHLCLYPAKDYEGLGEIQFNLKKVPEELILDCKAQKITKLFVNNSQIKDIKHVNGFLSISSCSLKQGTNRIAVFYESVYDNDGNGLVSFTDTADGNRQYLYTQFQPYYATRVFPCFDQPDLKATMEISISAPHQWQILSNQYSTHQENNGLCVQNYLKNSSTYHQNLLKQYAQKILTNTKTYQERHKFKLEIFPKTKMLPTYLFCFVAGPYQRIQLPKQKQHSNVPMSLYCINSLFKYMQDLAPFIFQITIESLKFFEKFFGVPYSFNKYDQVFAHDYKAGAMENAGIVTFNDTKIFKEKVSDEDMLVLANTISHQLSHHWFGNLVTMKWWDDLWLNQSFADFMSHYCLEQIKGNIKTITYDSSLTAFVARKARGYIQDEKSTTHPIRAKVQNTIVADLIFDMITYSKGASTMQQLLFLMGKQNFSAGLKDHFNRYGFKNATLDQFMGELQKHFHNQDLTLEDWKKYWLQTVSFNILTPVWNKQAHSNCEKLTILNQPLKQEHPTLRPHKIMIALFKEDCSYDVIEAFVKPCSETVIEYDGSNKYKAILLNYGDQTFARITIDPASRVFFQQNINNINDVLTRTLIWKIFYDLVYSAVQPSIKFVDFFCKNIAGEKSDGNFKRQFDSLMKAINTYTPRKYRSELNTRIFYFILDLIPKIDPAHKNRLVILRQRLCQFASGEISIRILLAWREGKYQPLKHHQITLGQQWMTVRKAFAQKGISLKEKQALLQGQLKKDNSDGGFLNKAVCDSLKANKEQFEQLYNSFKDPKNQRSITLKTKMAEGWNHPYHAQFLKQYKAQYFKDIVNLSHVLIEDHFQFFVDKLLPNDDNIEETIEGLKGIKLDNDPKFDKIKADIRKYIEQFERNLRAYTCFEQGIN